MEIFKPKKGIGYIEVIAATLIIDLLLIGLSYFAATYELLILIRLVLLVFNCYQLYYLSLYYTLKFTADENNIYINGNYGLKNIVLPFDKIEKYFIKSEAVKGIRLSGYGSKTFALGRTVIDKIGTTYMFATSNKNIFYLKTALGNFALSLEDAEAFEKKLESKNIEHAEWEIIFSKYSGINKEKKFIAILVIASIITVILTINPYIWYLRGKLPVMSPLSFDANFYPVKFGTAKQFVFKQMTYGVMNMGVLFCMYYAAYFCAKYDKNTAYRLIYIAMIISLAFLAMQYRILLNFK